MDKTYEMDENTVLSVRNLRTFFKLKEGTLKAVNNMSFDVKRGKVIGIVGESGCGKSITSRSILRLIKKPGYSEGEVLFRAKDGTVTDLISLPSNSAKMREIRGPGISMIFQEPMNALSPVHTVGDQLTEAMLIHDSTLAKEAAVQKGIQLLEKVGIANPAARMNEYPFQMSGGMRQRIMIAMAISCNPALLIADEPTTALDVSVQAQILQLLKNLQNENEMSMIFITHDLSVVAQMADQVAVMYLGVTVESAPAEELFYHPQHPYTKKLLGSILDPRKNYNKKRLETIKGNVPEPINLPDRCPFYGRCEERLACCEGAMPPFALLSAGHYASCYRAQQEAAGTEEQKGAGE